MQDATDPRESRDAVGAAAATAVVRVAASSHWVVDIGDAGVESKVLPSPIGAVLRARAPWR